MEKRKQIKRAWEEIRRRYNGLYVDVEVLTDLKKRGVKVYY